MKKLQKYLSEFSLVPSHDLGTIVWRCNEGLQLGIIVGRDELGNKYVIHNNNQRFFDVTEIDNFSSSGYSFRDTNNENHKRLTALKAFDLLVKYNKFNKITYSEDFKFEVPIVNEIGKEAIGFGAGVNHVVTKSLAIDKVNNVVENSFKKAGNNLLMIAQLFTRQLNPRKLSNGLKPV